jgi:hypothetical protein
VLHNTFPSNAYGVIEARDLQDRKQDAKDVTLLQSVNNGILVSKLQPENELENVVALVQPENISRPTVVNAVQFVKT